MPLSLLSLCGERHAGDGSNTIALFSIHATSAHSATAAAAAVAGAIVVGEVRQRGSLIIGKVVSLQTRPVTFPREGRWFE